MNNQLLIIFEVFSFERETTGEQHESKDTHSPYINLWAIACETLLLESELIPGDAPSFLYIKKLRCHEGQRSDNGVKVAVLGGIQASSKSEVDQLDNVF